MALNDKQQRFVDEYIIDLNATQAAIRAGYSPKTAGSQAFDLLKKPEIQSAVEEAKKAREKRTHITQDWVIREMVEQYHVADQRVPKIAFDGEQMTDVNGAPVFVPVDSATAAKMLDSLAKHTGAYDKDNKVEHSGGLIFKWGSRD